MNGEVKDWIMESYYYISWDSINGFRNMKYTINTFSEGDIKVPFGG